jgi:hypothetical protein
VHLKKKGSLGTSVKLLPCDHEVMGSESWRQPLAEMHEKAGYIRPKVVGSFSEPCTSGSYVHRVAVLLCTSMFEFSELFFFLYPFGYFFCNYFDILFYQFQIGGRSEIKEELVYRFIFPERPGALMNFLDAFSPRWNISLFHYRAQVCNDFVFG